MKWRDRRPRPNLRNLPVPPHRPGFWDAVEEELARVGAAPRPAGADDSSEVVELVQPQPRTRSVSPWLVASAAAAVVLVLGGATAILIRPAADRDVVATPDTSLDADLDAESLGGEVATTVAQIVRATPWQRPRLRSDEAPELLVDAWYGAENRRWCSALVPEDAGQLASDATARQAEFSGGWGLAWDRTGGPGQLPDGSDCPDCGRSAFGVAGTGTTHEPDTGENRNATIVWSDGSFAQIGDPDPKTEKLTAHIVVDGQGCRYEVWSNLGEAHLRKIINSLRLVESLTAPPVELRTPSDQPTVVALGSPPWNAAPINARTLDPMLLEKWDELDIAAPQLVLADIGAELEGAELRTWGNGVAWDLESAPGHNGQNEPCAACGRGVAGIGWEPASEETTTSIPLPYRIEWSDGSFAEYGGRLADPALPRDRVLYFDPDTGEEITDALQAVVHIPAAEVEVVVWTHLGEGHLTYLLEQLRVATSG